MYNGEMSKARLPGEFMVSEKLREGRVSWALALSLIEVRLLPCSLMFYNTPNGYLYVLNLILKDIAATSTYKDDNSYKNEKSDDDCAV